MALWKTLVCAGLLVTTVSCGRGRARSDSRPYVAATTTMVGDVVRQVAGDAVEVRSLIPPDTDPHAFIFRPSDLASVAGATLTFANGGGLEGQLDRLLEVVSQPDRVIRLDQGMPEEGHNAGEEQGHVGHRHDQDPHFWTDPHLVMIWTDTIRDALSRAFPDQADGFAHRAAAVRAELEELDRWIQDQVKRIPPDRRVLITDHFVFGYFAHRYGFDETGVVIEGFSSLAQPSARELVTLIEQLRVMAAPVIFVGLNVNPTIAERIAADTGTQVARIYSGSLSGPDGPAPDYFSYMRYNVNLMVHYLSGAE